ncbi:MAG: metallophosphoesterase family protein [Chloroflexi bacterium]|nr:metallophosphoesterase family protein [Chloroflexota bacterium]
MRIAIISDIHANLTAFRAVLDHAKDGGAIDGLWCLGDIVGYGPHPNECIAELRSYDNKTVAGNHDLAACGKMGTEDFNEAAASAAQWTEGQLSDDARSYLENLPMTVEEGDFTFVHGSLRWPEWEYLLSGEQAQAQFELQKTPISLVGHTHLPAVCLEDEAGPPTLRPAADGERLELGDGRWIINPGGAGQPRDGDPRASYAVYDSGDASITFSRVDYDISATQKSMEEAGLSQWLIERLAYGR